MPTSLVVKNGSNTRGKTSGGMPLPVSATRTATNSPLKPSSAALAAQQHRLGADGQRAARRHGVARIEGEIEQRQLELAGVDLDRAGPPRHAEPDVDVAAQRAAEHVLDLRQPLGEIDHAGLMHLPPREREQLPGQAFAARRRIGDGVEQLDLLIAADVAAQPRHRAADDHQEIVEVVGDAAGQLPDGFEPLRLAQRVLGEFAALCFVVEPLGPPQHHPQRGEQQQRDRQAENQMAADLVQPGGADRGAVDAGNGIDRIARQLAEADAAVMAVDFRIDRDTARA